MSAFRLVRISGEQTQTVWQVPIDRVAQVGRSDPRGAAPEVDLWPDSRVSRAHARIWCDGAEWWIEDQSSRHGTLVGGRQIRGQGAIRLDPWTELVFGDSVLMVAPPGWRRVRGRQLIVDLEVTPAVNLALAHCGMPVVAHLVVRNGSRAASPPARLALALGAWTQQIEIAVPSLAPGERIDLGPVRVAWDYAALEGQSERARCAFSVELDGHQLKGDPIESWVLAHNEWSCSDHHRLSLAAFVLPNHPLIIDAARVAASSAPDHALGAVYQQLAEGWHLQYRLEPPHWDSASQKIRLPHQVLARPEERTGEGTCIDLALVIAACLERLGLQPVVAILDMSSWRHALVGCWLRPVPPLEPLLFDRQRLLTDAIWADPTGVVRAVEHRLSFRQACVAAQAIIVQRPLVFALDVAAARGEGVTPLPFAGEPHWSDAASAALSAAGACAATAHAQLGTVALLLGLLRIDGLTRQMIVAQPRQPDPASQVARALARLPNAPPSRGYRHALDLARAQARDDGSPIVLEVHLLQALLEIRSESLDRVLVGLGIDRGQLLRTIRSMRLGGASGDSSSSTISVLLPRP